MRLFRSASLLSVFYCTLNTYISYRIQRTIIRCTFSIAVKITELICCNWYYWNLYSWIDIHTMATKKVAQDFSGKWNFCHCCGCIDGKHVRIIAPPHSGFGFHWSLFRSSLLWAVSWVSRSYSVAGSCRSREDGSARMLLCSSVQAYCFSSSFLFLCSVVVDDSESGDSTGSGVSCRTDEADGSLDVLDFSFPLPFGCIFTNCLTKNLLD